MVKTAAGLVAEARAQVKSLTPQEAFDEATSGRAVLLDVREPVEWEHHIEGALQIPRGIARVPGRSYESAPQRRVGSDPPGDRLLPLGRPGRAGRAHVADYGLHTCRQSGGGLQCLARGRPSLR